jgi:hypothetical protein
MKDFASVINTSKYIYMMIYEHWLKYSATILDILDKSNAVIGANFQTTSILPKISTFTAPKAIQIRNHDKQGAKTSYLVRLNNNTEEWRDAKAMSHDEVLPMIRQYCSDKKGYSRYDDLFFLNPLDIDDEEDENYTPSEPEDDDNVSYDSSSSSDDAEYEDFSDEDNDIEVSVFSKKTYKVCELSSTSTKPIGKGDTKCPVAMCKALVEKDRMVFHMLETHGCPLDEFIANPLPYYSTCYSMDGQSYCCLWPGVCRTQLSSYKYLKRHLNEYHHVEWEPFLPKFAKEYQDHFVGTSPRLARNDEKRKQEEEEELAFKTDDIHEQSCSKVRRLDPNDDMEVVARIFFARLL